MSDSDVFQINTEINEEEIAKARAYLGVPLRIQQYNNEATRDTIRHYAYGVGDDNPLWCDPDYAASGPHGTIVAPPTFFYTFFSAGITPEFDGLQAFFGGGKFKISELMGDFAKGIKSFTTGLTDEDEKPVSRKADDGLMARTGTVCDRPRVVGTAAVHHHQFGGRPQRRKRAP